MKDPLPGTPKWTTLKQQVTRSRLMYAQMLMDKKETPAPRETIPHALTLILIFVVSTKSTLSEELKRNNGLVNKLMNHIMNSP